MPRPAPDPENPTVRAAMFGQDVKRFLQTEIGSYLVKKADTESQAALRDLREVDPFDGPKVSACQMRVKVAEAVIVWLGDAIVHGEEAIELLKQEQE